MFLFLVLFTATVNGQIPVDSLVGYYPFNNNVNDESIYLNHGVIIISIIFTKERVIQMIQKIIVR